ERGTVELAKVEPGMPAEAAGLKKGDIVLSANGEAIHSQIKFHEITKNSGGKPIAIELERNGAKQTVTVKPVYSRADGSDRWMVGVLVEQKLNLITTRLSLPDAVRESVRQNAKGAALVVQFLKGVVQRRMSPKSITGPIGIAQLSGEAAREGPSAFFMLMSMV